MIRVADYIVEFLVKNNIRDIFVLTGFGAMYLNDAIAAKKGLRYYCVRNEATSPMMAEAYARITQGVGAVCLTAGPGSTNAVPGLAEAFVDSAPILVISGQVEKTHTTHYLKMPGLRTFGTAEIDIVPIVKPLTKYSVMVDDPKMIGYHLQKALYLAREGRPGPVWLDIPQDIQSAKINLKELKKFSIRKIKNGSNLKKIDDLIKLLKTSKRPLVIAGHGIRLSNKESDFLKIIEILKIPVVMTRLGLDLFPYSHELNMGLGGIKGTRFSTQILKNSDLILVLGARLAIPFVGPNMDAFGTKAKIISVDISEAELNKAGVKIHLKIKSNLKDFLPSFLKSVVEGEFPHYSKWLHFCQELKEKNPMIIPSMIKDPIDLYYFMSRIDALSTKKNILITDAGSNYYVGGQVWRFEKGQREITSATFAAMGLSIPLAIGAAVGKPKHQVLAVTGDGSLELNIQELKTMSYYNLNIKLFVANNGGYVSMRNWQDKIFEGRRIGSDETTGIPVLNLKNIARAFDLKYDHIDKFTEIDNKIKKIMSKKGPLFIEVVCDNAQRIIEPMKDY